MFEAAIGQRQLVFSWSPPPVIQRNGVITSYTISCSPSPSSLPQFPSQSGPLTVTGFYPNTFYSCSVVALNRRGPGPPAITNFTTQEDCMSCTCSMSITCMVKCTVMCLHKNVLWNDVEIQVGNGKT